MQPQYGVEAVEKASKLDDVLWLDVVVVQAREQTAEAAHLVLDLGVRTAQRGGCVAECSVDDWDEDLFVGALVREQLALEVFEYIECCGEVCVVGAQPSATPQICSTTGRRASCCSRIRRTVATSSGAIVTV
jgi:hypothetical protein